MHNVYISIMICRLGLSLFQELWIFCLSLISIIFNLAWFIYHFLFRRLTCMPLEMLSVIYRLSEHADSAKSPLANCVSLPAMSRRVTWNSCLKVIYRIYFNLIINNTHILTSGANHMIVYRYSDTLDNNNQKYVYDTNSISTLLGF